MPPKKRKQPSPSEDALADAMLSLTKDQLKRIHVQLEQENREHRVASGKSSSASSTLPPSLNKEEMVAVITQLRNDNAELAKGVWTQRLQQQCYDANRELFKAQVELCQVKNQLGCACLKASQQEGELLEQKDSMTKQQALLDQQHHIILYLQQQQAKRTDLTAYHQLNQELHQAKAAAIQQQARAAGLQEQLVQARAAAAQLQQQLRMKNQPVQQPVVNQHPSVIFARAIVQGRRPRNKTEWKLWTQLVHSDKVDLQQTLSKAERELCEDAARKLNEIRHP